MREKRSSNVPIEPAKSAGCSSSRSRSTRSTSDRFGTIRYGSSSRASRYRRSRSATFPAFAGPVIRVRPTTDPCYFRVRTAFARACALCANFLGGGRLGPASSSCDLLAGHLAGAGVAQVSLLRPAARVGEVDAHHGPLGLLDFLAAVVAHQPRYTCHGFPPRIRCSLAGELSQSVANQAA